MKNTLGKDSKEFFYLTDSSVSDLDAILHKYSNRIFEKSSNLHISKASQKGYQAAFKNPLFSKGARNWFSKVLIQIASNDEPDKSFIKFSYSQTFLFNLSVIHSGLIVLLFFFIALTALRFEFFSLKTILPLLSVLLLGFTAFVLFYNINKWGKEEQQTEVRLALLELLKSEGVTLKRVKNI